MQRFLILSLCLAHAFSTPVDTFEGRRIGGGPPDNSWDSFHKTAYGVDPSNDQEEIPEEVESVRVSGEKKDNIYHLKDGKLKKSSVSHLSKVMDSDLYSREVVYHSDKGKISSDSKDSFNSDTKDLVKLLPLKDQNEPQRVVIYRKKSPLVKLMNGLYEIIADMFYIVSYTSGMTPLNAQDKSDGGNKKKDVWPLIRNVFIKYFKLVKESELLEGLEEVLPIERIEKELSEDDGKKVWRTIYNSLSPKFFAYAFNTVLEAFFFPMNAYNGAYSNAIDADFREIAETTFNVLDHVRRMGAMFGRFLKDHFQFYGTSVARSLSSYFYPEITVDGKDYDGRDAALTSSTSYTVPVVAGVSGAVIAASSLLIYRNFMSSNAENELDRQKRSLVTPLEEEGMSLDAMNSILDAVQNVKFFGDDDDADVVESSRSLGQKNKQKKYSAQEAKDMLVKQLQQLTHINHPLTS